MLRHRLSSLLLIFSLVAIAIPSDTRVAAQDLVQNDDLAGGSSVFVFRNGRKRPQTGMAGGRVMIGSNKAKAKRSNAQIAAAEKKRRQAYIAKKAAVARASANRKITLSNTLTAKAEGFLEKDDPTNAITNYRAALVQHSKNTRAAEGLSSALTAKGIQAAGENSNPEAMPYFEEAVKLDNKNDVALAKLGAIYEARGEGKKAVEFYEKALAINPEYSTLFAPVGIGYIEAGEIAKAENYLAKAEAAKLDDADVRFLKGLVSFKQNKNAEALAAFDRAIELDGRFVEAQYYRGQVLDREGKAPQAVAAYKKVLDTDPGFAPASFDLGVAYYNTGDYTNAEAAYKNALASDPNNYQAHANLASTYRQQEKYPEANAQYKAAEVGIKNADLYSEWGFCLGKVSDWNKAVARLEAAKQMSPTAIDNTNVGWGYYNAGYTQNQAQNKEGANKNFALAKTYLETAVQQDPKLDAAYLNLGSTHNALGEFDRAVNVLKSALGLRKNWVIATNQLGIGFRGLGDLASAISTFKQVVNLDGSYVSGLFNLGEAYNASGNKKEAKKVNDKLRKINPALAGRLDSILSGKAVVDAATKQIQNSVPKKPSIPRLPF